MSKSDPKHDPAPVMTGAGSFYFVLPPDHPIFAWVRAVASRPGQMFYTDTDDPSQGAVVITEPAVVTRRGVKEP